MITFLLKTLTIKRDIMSITDNYKNIKLGFNFKPGSVLTKRTIMLNELQMTFDFIDNLDATEDLYQAAIVDENCTRKKSANTRKYTYSYLKSLYVLDPEVFLFKAFLYFWERDVVGRPILAFLLAYSRDSLLRKISSFIYTVEEFHTPSKEKLEDYIESAFPDRFSPVMKASLGRNLLSAWTQAGFIEGRVKKKRTKAIATPGSVAYALLLSYITGNRGQNLFNTDFLKFVDCSTDKAIELAEEASLKGWLVFKKVGNVIEVLFPNLISREYLELINE